MSRQSTQLDFSGQHFYIGLDVHKNNWTVTIRSNQMTLKTFSMNPSPADLIRHMKRHYCEGIYHSVYEAGFCGYWIHRQLLEGGFDNIITNPADVPTIHKEKNRKSDKVDSRKLSRELSNVRYKICLIKFFQNRDKNVDFT